MSAASGARIEGVLFDFGGVLAESPLDFIAEFERERADFDVVVESWRVHTRKPEPRIYEIACAELGCDPAATVFLDDIGGNLKPAREMGMTTIKFVGVDAALGELERVCGMSFGGGSSARVTPARRAPRGVGSTE